MPAEAEANRAARIRGRVVEALRAAGRPLARGELYMFRGLGNPRSVELQAALDALERAGVVQRDIEHGRRGRRPFIT